MAYLLVLLGCLLGTLPLEIFLGVRVYRRWRRLVLALLPTVVLFTAWDVAAIAAGHWRYDARQLSGIRLPGGLPLEELLFFLVVPTCAILGLEAVRVVRGRSVGEQ
ncbi:MAG: lycopene cyclase domain-containing protein [Pseudonocardiales bacterium]